MVFELTLTSIVWTNNADISPKMQKKESHIGLERHEGE